MARIVALLDSMWNWRNYDDAGARAPHYFRINPYNNSGRRFYRLVGSHHLLCTNCYAVVRRRASYHGMPDLEWTKENLRLLTERGAMDLLLVCGRVAQYTFEQIASIPSLGATDGTSFIPKVGTIRWYMMDHPAARRWSIDKMERSRLHIERLLCPE